MTLNVRGIKSKRKYERFLKIVHDEDVDVAAIQETNLVQAPTRCWHINPRVSKVGSGTAVYIKNTAAAKMIENVILVDGYLQKVVVEERTGQVTWIINVYMPQAKKSKRIEQDLVVQNLRKAVKESEGARVVILGDWNVVLEQRDRSKKENRVQLAKDLRGILAKRFEDVWRFAHPHATQISYTFETKTSRARLDRIYMSRDLSNSVINAKTIKYENLSDHSAVIMETDNAYNPYMLKQIV